MPAPANTRAGGPVHQRRTNADEKLAAAPRVQPAQAHRRTSRGETLEFANPRHRGLPRTPADRRRRMHGRQHVQQMHRQSGKAACTGVSRCWTFAESSDVRLRGKLRHDAKRRKPRDDVVEHFAMLAQVLVAAQQRGGQRGVLARTAAAANRAGQRLRLQRSLD